MDAHEPPTLQGFLLSVVGAINKMISGSSDGPLDANSILAEIQQGEESEGILEQPALYEMLTAALAVLRNFITEHYEVLLILPIETGMRESVCSLIVRTVLLGQGTSITARTFLRKPVNLKRLSQLIVIFGAACIDEDVQADGEGEASAEEGVMEVTEPEAIFATRLGVLFFDTARAKAVAELVLQESHSRSFLERLIEMLVATHGEKAFQSLGPEQIKAAALLTEGVEVNAALSAWTGRKVFQA